MRLEVLGEDHEIQDLFVGTGTDDRFGTAAFGVRTLSSRANITGPAGDYGKMHD